MTHPLFPHLTPGQIEAAIARIWAVPTIEEHMRNPHPEPSPWTVAINPDARAAFFAKLRRCKSIRTPSRPYDVSQLHKKWGGQCVYCGRHLPHPYEVTEETPGDLIPCKEHLISLSMGCGQHSKGVLACIGCNARKRNMDWLEFGAARSPAVKKKLAALRLELGKGSFNHLSPDPKVHTPLKVGRMLDARWQHQRFKVFAAVTDGGAFIGWKSSWPMPQAALFTLKGLKGKLVSQLNGYTTLHVYEFERPGDALTAIWELIELNGWVLGFDLEADGFTDITPADAPRWRFWSPNFKDLCTREFTKARNRRPKWARRDRE
jgi:hypothetical protein